MLFYNLLYSKQHILDLNLCLILVISIGKISECGKAGSKDKAFKFLISITKHLLEGWRHVPHEVCFTAAFHTVDPPLSPLLWHICPAKWWCSSLARRRGVQGERFPEGAASKVGGGPSKEASQLCGSHFSIGLGKKTFLAGLSDHGDYSNTATGRVLSLLYTCPMLGY